MTHLHKTLLLAAGAGVGAWLAFRKATAYSFANRVVLITGGSRGLGLVIARELTRRGARVAICARDNDELERAADDLANYGAEPFVDTCDVTDPRQVGRTVTAVEEYLGPIDVLINNAGIIKVGPISTMTREDFEESLAVNFWGAYNTCEAVLPSMRRRESGRIVNISSIGGLIGIPHLIPYCVGKFALVGYSRGLRAELANNGIVVTTVCPGLMRTGSSRHGFFKGQTEREYAWFKVSGSLPGITISAEHAARAILKACSYGKAEAILSVPAQFGVLLQASLPELTAALISVTNRLLPRPGEAGTQAQQGRELEPAPVSGVLTALTDEAAKRNNEIAPSEP